MSYVSLHQFPYGDGYGNTGLIGYKNLYYDPITSGAGTTIRSMLDGNDLHQFKFWVPPGAIDVSFYAHCSQGSGPSSIQVIRAGQEPDITKKPSDSGSLPTDGATISQIQTADYWNKNSAGYIFLVKDRPATTVTTGFWIYVAVVEMEERQILDIASLIILDKTIYMAWFNSATWGADGDPAAKVGIPITPTGTGLSFDPVKLDFGQTRENSTSVLRMIFKNISLADITINQINLPDGFTYKFVNEFNGYQAYDFKSVYQIGYAVDYEDNGQFKNTVYKGFKNIFNFTDSIICCGKANDTNCCGKQTRSDTHWFDFEAQTTDTLLRVYVPYGSTSFKYEITVSDGAVMIAFVRWKQPPDNFYEDSKTGLFDNHWTSQEVGPIAFDDLYSDKFIRPLNNIFTITDGQFAQDNQFDKQNGWLYVIIRAKSGSVLKAEIQNTVDTNYFKNMDVSKFKADGDPPDDYVYNPLDIPKNPTEYESMTFPYYRTKEVTFYEENIENPIGEPNHFGFELHPLVSGVASTFAKYQRYSRIFVPPGTVRFEITFGKSLMADASFGRYLQIPESNDFIEVTYECWDTPQDRLDDKPMDCNEFSAKYSELIYDPDTGQWLKQPATASDGGGFESYISQKDLARLKQDMTSLNDCKQDLPGYNRDGKNWTIVRIDLQKPLSASEAGWFYVKLNTTNASDNSHHSNNSLLIVDSVAFNDWWDNGGSNTDKSVNWDKDVESMEKYVPLSYSPTLRPPASIMNPTSYQTVHNPYWRLPEIESTGTKWTYRSGTADTSEPGQQTHMFVSSVDFREGATQFSKIRMFIPPGTVQIRAYSYEKPWADNKYQCLSYYKSIPNTTFPTNTYEPTQQYSLFNLESGTCHSITDSEGRLYICKDSFTSAALTVEQSGWLYVYSNTVFKKIIFMVEVYMPAYNVWWKTCGSNADKSINWDKDVEDCIKYIPIINT